MSSRSALILQLAMNAHRDATDSSLNNDGRNIIQNRVNSDLKFTPQDPSDVHIICNTSISVTSQYCNDNDTVRDSINCVLDDEHTTMHFEEILINGEGTSVDQESNDFTASDEEPLGNLMNKYNQNKVTDVDEDGEVLFEVPVKSPFELPLDIRNEIENQNANLIPREESNEDRDLILEKQSVTVPTPEYDEMGASAAINSKTKKSTKHKEKKQKIKD